MSTSGINFSGLASGIDTESIIQQLLKLDQRPMQLKQQEQKKVQQQQSALNQFQAALASMQAAAGALDATDGFSIVKANSGDDTIATVTAQAGAAAGSHTLQVKQLAQAQRIGSTVPFASQNSALGVAGQIVINGKAINVANTDTLQGLASNINSAGVGVNASIISTASNSYTLVLAAANSGVANAISISDTAGGSIVRGTLGLVGAATGIDHPITNGAASGLFTDSSTSVGTLLGLTSPQAGTIGINGTNVAIDFATDSLSAIAAKINGAAIAGVTANVVATTDPVSGANKQQLQITGAATPTFTDSNNILTNLGILQNAPSQELAQAKDALFKIDGLDASRSSNTLSDVLGGTTIKMVSDTGQPTTTIDVTADTDTIKKNINSFVASYNQLVGTYTQLASYDTSTNTGGPLFGDVTVQDSLNSVTDILTGAIPGLSGTPSLLADLGITLDQTGTMNVDDATLSSALANNLSAVTKIFKAVGVTTDNSITFISATDKTKASATAAYNVNVTQLATQASVTAGTSHTANNNASTETLTFAGGQFGTTGHTVLLNPNSSLDDIISQINGDTTVQGIVTASKVSDGAGGYKLALTAKAYGSSYNFSVVSSQAAAANSSGIGNTPLSGSGVDVAGTINGEAATGNGQFLTGASGNATTDGLQLRVTATTTGSHGNITFTQGLAAQIKYYANNSTDLLTGSLSLYSQELTQQSDDLGQQISDMQDSLKSEEDNLRQRFSAMEGAVAQLKAAGNGLSALTGISFTSPSK